MAPARINHRKAKAGTQAYADVRQRIVDAAIQMMAKDGFGKFRLEALAGQVGCSRATIYRYYDSKQELMTEVMMTLMNEITADVVKKTAGTQRVTRARFAAALHEIIADLQHNSRYAIVMDASNVETFAQLSHEHLSAITSTMLKRFMTDSPSGRVLKQSIRLPEAVHWLMHQIVSYGFFGLPGGAAKEQRDYLKKMVASVILE